MKNIVLTLSLVFGLALILRTGSASAVDQAGDAYAAYAQTLAPLEQQLYAKQAELEAVYASVQPDTAKAQELFREIGELRGQIFAAQAGLRAQLGDGAQPYGGPHHWGGRGGWGHGGRWGGHGGRHRGW